MSRLVFALVLLAAGCGSEATRTEPTAPEPDEPAELAPQSEWTELTGERADALQATIDRAAAEHSLTGMAVSVAFNETKELWAGATGYSDIAAKEPWTSSRAFRIGSVTKTFTTAAIYLLIEDGRLSLDDSLEQWVPGYFDGRGVTLRHLITNTSGIVSYNYVGSFDDTRPWTPEELVAWAVQHEPELRFEPGTEWQYSNTNFVLLGMVLEAASGETYEVVVGRRLLEPLLLAETYVASSGDENPDVVPSYDAALNPVFADPSFGWSAGAMVSTPRDLARWAAALFGGDVLSDASFIQMTTPVGLPESNDYAHGVFAEVSGEQALYGHTGGFAGFLTSMYTWRSDDITLVVMCNVLEVDLRALSGTIWLTLVDP